MRLAKDYSVSSVKKNSEKTHSVHIRRNGSVKIPLTKERSRYHGDAQDGDEELIIRRLRRKYSVEIDDNVDKVIDKIIDMGWDITNLQLSAGDKAFYVKATKKTDDVEEIAVDRKAVRLKLAFLLVLQAIVRDWGE
tara:strand:- start:4475 stop:4882 length:408 start_codon:yes stop_codon:yes gene_type:complete